jgi:putative Holliday junction resolvase
VAATYGPERMSRSSTRRWQTPLLRANRCAVTAPPRRPGRVCGLDPGRARIGVAVDDELGLLAHPRGTLDPRDPKALAEALREFATREDVGRFVVGLPLHLRGGEGASAREARRLAQLVADATGCTVELWDERLSTVQASRALAASEVRGKKARAHIDEAAACAILQSWLDARQARRQARRNEP